MQLEQYFKKSDIFLKSAEVYMQHNFKVQVGRPCDTNGIGNGINFLNIVR